MIRLATKKAKESKFGRARVGACICSGGRILSSGVNRIGYSRYRLDRRFPESIHAEVAAIVELLKARRSHELVGSTLYVSRIDASGAPRMARPCSNCQRIIEAVGIRKVFYTTNEGTVCLRCNR